MIRNLIISILILYATLGCTYSYANNGVLVSKSRLYPNSIKTPQDIADWLLAERFVYRSDKTEKDEWKTPKQTVKDKAGDCEDYAVLIALILKDLGYENVMLIALYGKDLAHGICWFKEKDGTWNYFGIGRDRQGKREFYHPVGVSNPFHILYRDFPEWTHICICTTEGDIVRTYYREKIERSKK